MTKTELEKRLDDLQRRVDELEVRTADLERQVGPQPDWMHSLTYSTPMIANDGERWEWYSALPRPEPGEKGSGAA